MAMTPLQSALAELKRSGASGLPTVAQIEAAPNGKTWEEPGGEGWALTKNNPDSYNVRC